MEEDPQQDSDARSEREFGLEEFLFFLIESGLPESAVYGWHSGWSFDRLERAFRYFKRREVEKQQSDVLVVSIGASSLFSKKAIEEYNNSTNRVIQQISRAEKNSKSTLPPKKIANELGKLTGLLNG